MNKKNTIITDWLDKHGDPQIEKRVMERLDKITKELIINEAYENYYNHMRDDRQWELDKEEFIDKIKTDTEFSEKWGLKIEERELSWEERFELFKKQNNGSHPYDNEMLDDYNIPTKLITITYNNKTIESYE
jgi:hypothetical protein